MREITDSDDAEFEAARRRFESFIRSALDDEMLKIMGGMNNFKPPQPRNAHKKRGIGYTKKRASKRK